MHIPGWRYNDSRQSHEYSDANVVIVLHRVSNTSKNDIYRVFYYLDDIIRMDTAILTGTDEDDVKKQAVLALENYLNSVQSSLTKFYSSLQMAKQTT